MPSFALLGTFIKFCHLRRDNQTGFAGKKSSESPNHFTFNYLVSGKMEVEIKGFRFAVAKGDALLWEPGVARIFRTLPGKPLSFYAMGFEPASVGPASFSLGKMGLKPFCRVSRKNEMENLLRKLHGVFKDKGAYHDQECSMLGLRILLLLKPWNLPVSLPVEGPDDRPSSERIQDVLDYIHKNYKKRIGVETLASKVLMHPVNFTRFFKKATGLTPHQYILRVKVDKAKDFLLLYNESLTTTAVELGFHDYAHFYRVFKGLAGISPKQFLADSRSA